MRLHRFYVAQPLGEEVVIEDVSLINQWTKVFRYTEGDFVILFNGDGFDYSYSLVSVSKNSCSLVTQSSSPVYVPNKKTFLYLAIIKKDNFEVVVQKATELGVTDIMPLISERTEVKQLDTRRLRIIIKEAAEQSGRGDIPTLHEQVNYKDIKEHLTHNNVEASRTFVTTLFGKPVLEMVTNFNKNNTAKSSPLAFVVGPEGGWTDVEEKFIVENNFIPASLGATTMRAETAGIVSSFLSTLF